MRFLCIPGDFVSADEFRNKLAPLITLLENTEDATFNIIQGPHEFIFPPELHPRFGSGTHYAFSSANEVGSNPHPVNPAVVDAATQALGSDATAESIIHHVISTLHLPTSPPSNQNSQGTAENATSPPQNSQATDYSAAPTNWTISSTTTATGTSTIAYIRAILAQEGDIEGLLGHAEGALHAASFLLDQHRRELELTASPRISASVKSFFSLSSGSVDFRVDEGVDEWGSPVDVDVEGRMTSDNDQEYLGGDEGTNQLPVPKIKCAVFISGWCPVDPISGEFVLAEASGACISVPTVHVVSESDPGVAGAMALWNLCQYSRARILRHEHGHDVPGDEETVANTWNEVRNMVREIRGLEPDED